MFFYDDLPNSTDMLLYYVNTNEIPSEPSRENMLFSHVKTSLLPLLLKKIAPFDGFREMI